MLKNRFDITYISGRRDTTAWNTTSKQIDLLSRSPQVNEEALRARTAFAERHLEGRMEMFPNAIYFGKGRDPK